MLRILCTTDGQPYSEQALRFAGKLFSLSKPSVTVVHVRPPKAREPLAKAKQYLVRAKEIFKEFDIIPRTTLLEGDITKNIVQESVRGKYDLLVMGSKETSRVMGWVVEKMLGKDTERMVRSAPLSLLVVKHAPDEIRRVLLCTDGSPYAESALHFWGTLPKPEEPKAVVLNIIPQVLPRFSDLIGRDVKEELLKVYSLGVGPQATVLNRGKAILEQYGIHPTTKLRAKEYAAEEILDEAKKGNVDLVVLGYRGKKWRSNSPIGSQALKVVEQCTTSVLVYRKRVA